MTTLDNCSIGVTLLPPLSFLSFFFFWDFILRFCCVCVSGNVFLATCENVRTSVLFCFVSFLLTQPKRNNKRETVCAVKKEYTSPKESRLLRIECRGERWAKVFLWVIPSCCVSVCVRVSSSCVYIQTRRQTSRAEINFFFFFFSQRAQTQRHTFTRAHKHSWVGKEKKIGGGLLPNSFSLILSRPVLSLVLHYDARRSRKKKKNGLEGATGSWRRRRSTK